MEPFIIIYNNFHFYITNNLYNINILTHLIVLVFFHMVGSKGSVDSSWNAQTIGEFGGVNVKEEDPLINFLDSCQSWFRGMLG